MPATATLKSRSIQGESLSAAADRLINTILLNEGVVDKAANSFQVTQNLGTDMNVKIGSGTAYDRAVVEGDNVGQGTFVVEHQNASQVLPIAASDPTNDRIDIVVLRVYDDTFDSSGNDYADLEIVQGTPAASPSAPAVPTSAIKLAEVLVQNGVTQIVNGDITDFRVEAGVKSRSMPVVRARGEAGAASAMNTSEQTKLSVNLAIPRDWNTYDVDVFASWEFQDNGAAGPALATVRIKYNSVLLNQPVSEELSNAADEDFEIGSVMRFGTGLSATGTIAVTLTTQLSAESSNYNIDQVALIAYAWRTS